MIETFYDLKFRDEKYWRPLGIEELEKLIEEKPVNKDELFNLLQCSQSIIFISCDCNWVNSPELYGHVLFYMKEGKPKWKVHIDTKKNKEKQKATLVHELIHIYYGVMTHHDFKNLKCEDLIDKEASKIYENEPEFANWLLNYFNANITN